MNLQYSFRTGRHGTLANTLATRWYACTQRHQSPSAPYRQEPVSGRRLCKHPLPRSKPLCFSFPPFEVRGGCWEVQMADSHPTLVSERLVRNVKQHLLPGSYVGGQSAADLGGPAQCPLMRTVRRAYRWHERLKHSIAGGYGPQPSIVLQQYC